MDSLTDVPPMKLPMDILVELLIYLDNKTKIYLLSTSTIFTKYKMIICLEDQEKLTSCIVATSYYDRFMNLVVDEFTPPNVVFPKTITHLNIANCNQSINVPIETVTHLGVGDRTNLLNLTKNLVQLPTKLTFIKKIMVKSVKQQYRWRVIARIARSDDYQNLVIKNLRITNQHQIKKIRLELGGCEMEEINGNLFDGYRHLLKINDPLIIPFGILSNDSFVPFLEEQTIVLYIDIDNDSNDFEISYEIHKTDIDISQYQSAISINTLHYMATSSTTDIEFMSFGCNSLSFLIDFQTGNGMYLLFWFNKDISINIILNLYMKSNTNDKIIIKPKKIGKYYIMSFSDSMLEYGILWNQIYFAGCYVTTGNNDGLEMSITSIYSEIVHIKRDSIIKNDMFACFN